MEAAGPVPQLRLPRSGIAKYIGIGRDTMSGRMQGHNPWTSAEITAMCELLNIRQNEIGELFFPSLEKGESA